MGVQPTREVLKLADLTRRDIARMVKEGRQLRDREMDKLFRAAGRGIARLGCAVRGRGGHASAPTRPTPDHPSPSPSASRAHGAGKEPAMRNLAFTLIPSLGADRRDMGLRGIVRGKKTRTTMKARPCPLDRVNR
jgi:hypothetical protein